MDMKRLTTEQMLDLITEIDLVTPSAESHEAMVAQLNAVIKPKEQPTVWQRLTAQLQRDSAATTGDLVLSGARDIHLSEPESRDLLFTTDLVHVVLNVVPNGEQFTIDGQLFPQTTTISDQFTIQLVQNDTEIALTESDDLAEFSMPSVPAGSYEMVLCGDGVEVVIPVINLV